MIKSVLFDADGVIINGDFFSTQYQKEYNIWYFEELKNGFYLLRL